MKKLLISLAMVALFSFVLYRSYSLGYKWCDRAFNLKEAFSE